MNVVPLVVNVLQMHTNLKAHILLRAYHVPDHNREIDLGRAPGGTPRDRELGHVWENTKMES